MKKIVLIVLLFLAVFTRGYSQDWMTSMEVAKRLALVQDKMLLMMWEESTVYPLPVQVYGADGRLVTVKNMFENDIVNELIWDYFVPVVVSESNYTKLLNDMTGDRSQMYMDKFNDDSIKIMDINGNILNTAVDYSSILNLSLFINKYHLNTAYLKAELSNYSKERNFITAFRLASKYVDIAPIVNEDLRDELIALSTIYIIEAESYLSDDGMDDKATLQQKCDLLRLEQELVLGNSRKVLRKLKRLDQSNWGDANKKQIAFLYYTAYLILKDETNASPWRSQLSLVNLKKANQIININR